MDMAGNVWEWTNSLWGPNHSEPTYHYPYDPEDGRENMNASEYEWRIVRGGSWFSANSSRDVQCVRRWYYPHGKSDYIGFRVVYA